MTDEEIRQRVLTITNSCWDKALHAIAVYYILRRRADKIERLMNINKITGIIIPILIGSIATTYSDKADLLKIFILITSPIAILQLLLTGYLMASNKENNYTSFVAGAIKNNQLNHDFEHLARNPLPYPEFQIKYDLLCEKERLLKEDDSFSDKEQRKGMRYALKTYRRACAGCGIEPNNMQSTNCDVCGNF